jgi:hypothetical protein
MATATPNINPAISQTNTQAASGTITPADATGATPAAPQPAIADGSANNTPGTVPQTNGTPQWQNTSDQTVQGQLTGIIGQNSPLIQQARTRALEGMNDRGLINSSMAQTAADSAAYNAALPIAQADASQASKVAGTNVQNINNQNIANTEAQYKELTQGSASAANIMSNAQTQIANIMANTNITDKQAAIDQVKANVQQAMNLFGSLAGNLNLGQYVA